MFEIFIIVVEILKKTIFRSKNLSEVWLKLIGDPNFFSLESRIFHSISILIILSLVYYIPFNFIMGIPVTAFLSIFIGILFCFMYYRSRFNNHSAGNNILLWISANLYVICDYIYNSGINGPTNILATAALLLIIVVSPYKQHYLWLTSSMFVVLFLNSIAFYHPLLIHSHNNSRIGYFIDHSVAYLLAVILFYYNVKFIRMNYDYEHQLNNEKAKKIEDHSQYIQLQNHQLEYLNSEKDKLMSIIAHDLRAPLSNIENYLELVNEYEIEGEESLLIENDLLKATESTLNMLTDLLIWSNSQMEGQVINLTKVNLIALLENTLTMEQMHASNKKITLKWSIDSNINLVADVDMLQLVIRNLIGNAIKFTSPGGKIEVFTGIIANECMITIKDNGNGIPYSDQEKIFSLKASSTYGTNKEKGVGLGLLLCKDFTEKQGGRIGFESEPEKGSSFFIFMPLSSN